MTDPVQAAQDAVNATKTAVASAQAAAAPAVAQAASELARVVTWRDKLVDFAAKHPKTTLILWAVSLAGVAYLGFKAGHVL